jgi:cell division protease FtsH
MQRPEGDRYLLTQTELESRIQVLLAGTVAEEMIFDDISTGAQNDLERATEMPAAWSWTSAWPARPRQLSR